MESLSLLRSSKTVEELKILSFIQERSRLFFALRIERLLELFQNRQVLESDRESLTGTGAPAALAKGGAAIYLTVS